jgi:hypothetical protein
MHIPGRRPANPVREITPFGSLIPLQLPLSPMRLFAIGIEYALDVAV